jgi:hypothetical protein
MWTTNINIGGRGRGRNHYDHLHSPRNKGEQMSPGHCWACLNCIAVLIGSGLFLKLWFGYDLAELRINLEYLSPINGTCTVLESQVDAWACCSYQHSPSCNWQCSGTSCNTLMQRYDGSRETWLLQDTSRADQYCCDSACCFHQTCVTHHDDGDDHYHHHRRLGESSNAALEGSSSTSCQCDMWGTETYHFECETCYDGVVELAYQEVPTSNAMATPAKQQRGEKVDTTARSSQHPGPCSGSTSQHCAQGFVNDHPVGAKRPCWYDPAAPSQVVMRRGYTGWRWLMTLASFVLALLGCGCCCCHYRPWEQHLNGRRRRYGCCPCGAHESPTGLREVEMASGAPAPSYNTTLVQPSGNTMRATYGTTAPAPSEPVLQAYVVPE